MTDFRKKKLMYVFNVFFDVNHSGTIERKDFELAIETICRSRGWGESDPKYAETHGTLIKVWEGLRQRADTDQDLQVNKDEWIKMWDEYKKNPDNPLDWQKLYMNFMFDHIDSSGDGTIDLQEFTTVYTGYGLPVEECEKAYNKFTINKTKEINREAFSKLWNEFFTSDDPQAPGNFIFGKCSFE